MTTSTPAPPARPLPGFHVMAKPIGPICNLDCKYCFYLEKENLYRGTDKWAMQPEVLEAYISQYIEAQPSEDVSFAWQGGEPTLLGVDYFQNVLDLQKKHAGGKRIHNAFQTNGVLLDDSWGEFLSANAFLVGLSIDGPRELHDYYRVDKGGQPTFARVVRGAGVLKKHGVEFNTLTVLNRKNSCHPLEVYRFLKEMGSGYMQFIPIVERIASAPAKDGLVLIAPRYAGAAEVSPWSVEPQQFGRFLCAVFDEWVRNDVGRCFVQLFDVSLESWMGMEPSLCVFRRNCGTAMAMEHTGDLYSCDHFVYPENKLGNIMDQPLESLANLPQQIQFGKDKSSSLPKYCRTCEVRFACNGECPKHRFATTPDGEAGLNYLCAGYKMFFKHVDPHMKFMVEELRNRRAPANIMSLLGAQPVGAQQAQQTQKQRNQPCACGSGRKYKNCCVLRA